MLVLPLAGMISIPRIWSDVLNMNRDRLSAEEWCLVGLVMCCVTGVAGYAVGRPEGFSTADGAAWFQAIFSVVAIGVAVWVSQAEHRRQRAVKNAEERDSILGVAILINQGVALIEALSSHDVGKPSASAVHSFQVIAERLESLELIVRPSPVVLRCSLQAANNIRVYTENAERGVLEDHGGLAGRTANAAIRMLQFYGLSEADLPKERGQWVAMSEVGEYGLRQD
jgi:hypothetical protein